MTSNREIEPILSRLFKESNIDANEFVAVDDDVTTGPLETAPTDEDVDDDDDANEDNQCPALPAESYKDAHDCMQTLSAFAMQKGCTDDVLNTLSRLETLLDRHQQTTKVQAKLSDFFVTKT